MDYEKECYQIASATINYETFFEYQNGLNFISEIKNYDDAEPIIRESNLGWDSSWIFLVNHQMLLILC